MLLKRVKGVLGAHSRGTTSSPKARPPTLGRHFAFYFTLEIYLSLLMCFVCDVRVLYSTLQKYKSDLKHLNNSHINDLQRKIRDGLAQMRFAIQIKWIHAADLWIVAEKSENKTNKK